MEGGFIFIGLYPLMIAVLVFFRIVALPFRLLLWPIRQRKRRRKRQAIIDRDAYILHTARENAWAIHQATHPTPLKRKPWEEQ